MGVHTYTIKSPSFIVLMSTSDGHGWSSVFSSLTWDRKSKSWKKKSRWAPDHKENNDLVKSFHLNRKYAVVSGLLIPWRMLCPPSCQAYLTVIAFFAQDRGRLFLYQDLVSAYSSWMWQLCLPTRCQFPLTCQFSSKPKSCT